MPVRPRLVAVALLLLLSVSASAQVIIREFRLRGPNGANDEFIELYNNSGAAHTVTASGTGSGYGLAASDGVLRCSIPNGTIIPRSGHYLCVNSVGYSLASYPAGNGTTATGDATYTTEIPDNAGLALFTSNVPAEMTLPNRMDAVGSTAEANALYKEGTGYPVLAPLSADYSFYRDNCGKDGSITTFGPCPVGGGVADSNNNVADFIFVDPNGTSAGAGQRVGAPGPQNLSSPITIGNLLATAPLDPCEAAAARPNLEYDGRSIPAENATYGKLAFRRTYTNNTAAPITRMRFRIIDISTFPAPSGIADLRALTSPDVTVTVDRAPCGSGTSSVAVLGTTLEMPPLQPNGGGFNSSLSLDEITLATPLAPGASVDVHFQVGIQQHGQFKFGTLVETLPASGAALFEIEGCTDGCTGQPEAIAIEPIDPNPATPGSTLDYRVTFDSIVTGVDAADFALATTGSLAGVTITNVVAENGFNYLVTVNGGTGSGTIRLDVVDNNSITAAGDPLGGPAAGDGNFAGEEYLVAGDPPAVVSITRASANPTIGPTVNFTVTFDESVTGVDATDFALTTTGTIAGATIVSVAGAGATRTVTVDIGSGTGTIRLDVVDNDSIVDVDGEPLGGIGAGNGNFTTGEVYTVFGQALTSIPTLDPRMLLVLAVMIAGAAFLALRR